MAPIKAYRAEGAPTLEEHLRAPRHRPPHPSLVDPMLSPRAPWHPTYILAADLGDRNDFTALTIGECWSRQDAYQWDLYNPDAPPMLGASLERDFVADANRHRVLRAPNDLHVLRVRYIERFRGLGYPEVQRRMTALMAQAPLAAGPGRPRAKMLVDGTGVGAPIVQQLRKTLHGVIGITITSGMAASKDPGYFEDFRVPKRLLVQSVNTVMESDRLAIAPELPDAEHLKWELADFRVKIDEDTGYETFSARASEHDDIVLSLAMMCWYALQPRNFAETMRYAV